MRYFKSLIPTFDKHSLIMLTYCNEPKYGLNFYKYLMSEYYSLFPYFLNLVHASLKPVHNWFLEIAFVHDVSMFVCVCVSAPEAINN